MTPATVGEDRDWRNTRARYSSGDIWRRPVGSRTPEKLRAALPVGETGFDRLNGVFQPGDGTRLLPQASASWGESASRRVPGSPLESPRVRRRTGDIAETPPSDRYCGSQRRVRAVALLTSVTAPSMHQPFSSYEPPAHAQTLEAPSPSTGSCPPSVSPTPSLAWRPFGQGRLIPATVKALAG